MKTLFILTFISGLLLGHYVWGATKITYQAIPYDAVKNTAECEKRGGEIEFYSIYNPDGRDLAKFRCVVPSKVIELEK